jgi:hypothetical protein
MTSQPSTEVVEAEARPTDTDLDIGETATRPDLVWDNEVPDLCVRVHGNGEKSFIAQSSGSLAVFRRNPSRAHPLGYRRAWLHRLLPQSSSASRFTAGAAGFLILSQCSTRPER